MPGKEAVDFETLLRSPEVQKVTSNVNNEVDERRTFELPRCEAFLKPYTRLTVDERYSFYIDREARKQLPPSLPQARRFLTILRLPLWSIIR